MLDSLRQTTIKRAATMVITEDEVNRHLATTLVSKMKNPFGDWAAFDGARMVDQSTTLYSYDDANNRASKTVTRIAAPASSEEAGENEVGHWEYAYNAANQLTGWEKWDAPSGSLQKTATLSYDDAGNRTGQSVTTLNLEPETLNTAYTWDAQDRLLGVTMPDGSEHHYEYDYRTRRIGTSVQAPGSPPPAAKQTAIVFSGGLSVAEWESDTGSLPVSPTVEYTRGPDMGGGVGGLLYSLRAESGTTTPKYNLSNGRGDIVAQSNQSATLTWTASYEAYGKRTKETGTNQDKQRGSSKDEDPTGLLNEGFRYRDLETGVWLSRDPAGFVDGPNLYAYCVQNPWSKWDPHGLSWREWTSAALDFVPGVSTIKTAVELVAGKDLITGESVSRAESLASLGATVIPGGKGALKTAKMACKLADKAFEVNGKAEAVMAIAGDVADGHVDLNTLQQAASLRGGGKKGGGNADFRGGAHKDMQRPSIESHHMPAKSVSGLGEPKGPAIQMDPSDHAKTSSNGKRMGHNEYLENIETVISSNKPNEGMRGAMAIEMRDVRRVAREVGDPQKYNSAMRELMDYARGESMIPKNESEQARKIGRRK